MSTAILVLTWIVVVFIWISLKTNFNTANPREFLDWVTISLCYSIIPLLIGGWIMRLFE